ncbi:MAG TPA: hypothetical protein VLR26_13095, partial [Frankiaceae bacterium]|nr:hypothetical protein [Frankiaceae bacterium]
VIAALACGTASVVVAGSGLAAGASSQGQGDTHSHRTLTLYQRQGGLLFVPGPGPSDQGTQVVGSFDLHSGAINGRIVGHAVTQCILEGAPGNSPSKMVLCHSMNMVQGGQIATSGLFPKSNFFANPGAITGGTGTYRAATGQVTGTPLGDTENRNSKLVFDLGN